MHACHAASLLEYHIFRSHWITPDVEQASTAYRFLANFLIAKSSIRLPDFRCATSQRGCLPRPDHVSEGRSGFRYFGETGGYGRRSDTGFNDNGVNTFRRFSSASRSALIFSCRSCATSKCSDHRSSLLILSSSIRCMSPPRHDLSFAHLISGRIFFRPINYGILPQKFSTENLFRFWKYCHRPSLQLPASVSF